MILLKIEKEMKIYGGKVIYVVSEQIYNAMIYNNNVLSFDVQYVRT